MKLVSWAFCSLFVGKLTSPQLSIYALFDSYLFEIVNLHDTKVKLALSLNFVMKSYFSSSDELQATSAVRTINFDTPNVVEKVRTKISEFEVIKRSIFERFSTNRDGEAEIVESFDSQTSEENGECSKNVENLSDKTSTLFTGAMWLKQIENKDKLGKINLIHSLDQNFYQSNNRLSSMTSVL